MATTMILIPAEVEITVNVKGDTVPPVMLDEMWKRATDLLMLYDSYIKTGKNAPTRTRKPEATLPMEPEAETKGPVCKPPIADRLAKLGKKNAAILVTRATGCPGKDYDLDAMSIEERALIEDELDILDAAFEEA